MRRLSQTLARERAFDLNFGFLLEREAYLRRVRLRLLDQIGQRLELPHAGQSVDFRIRGENLFGVALSQASRDDQFLRTSGFAFRFGPAGNLEHRLSARGLDESTGGDHNGVEVGRFFVGLNGFVSPLGEKPGEVFVVDSILVASKGDDSDFQWMCPFLMERGTERR